jgi:hypothetical protein
MPLTCCNVWMACLFHGISTRLLTRLPSLPCHRKLSKNLVMVWQRPVSTSNRLVCYRKLCFASRSWVVSCHRIELLVTECAGNVVSCHRIELLVTECAENDVSCHIIELLVTECAENVVSFRAWLKGCHCFQLLPATAFNLLGSWV